MFFAKLAVGVHEYMPVAGIPATWVYTTVTVAGIPATGVHRVKTNLGARGLESLRFRLNIPKAARQQADIVSICQVVESGIQCPVNSLSTANSLFH